MTNIKAAQTDLMRGTAKYLYYFLTSIRQAAIFSKDQALRFAISRLVYLRFLVTISHHSFINKICGPPLTHRTVGVCRHTEFKTLKEGINIIPL